MNKFLIPVILSIIILLGISTVYAYDSPIPETIPDTFEPPQLPVSEPVEEPLVPAWIKILAGIWHDGGISDSEYIEAMEHLIESNIININGTNYDEMEAEAQEWKSKYDDAESRRVSQSQSDAATHQALYDETEKNADDRIKRNSDGHKVEIAEYTDIIHQRDAEIEDLKKQIKDLKYPEMKN